jgi:ubiquitin thioesterase protein OTUB1
VEFAIATSLSVLESTKPNLELAGIQQFVYEDFYDEFVQLIRHMVDPNLDIKKKKAMLLAAFQNNEGMLDLL